MDNVSLQKQIDELKNQLQEVSGEVYTRNFSTRKDYVKYSNFITMLKVPSYVTPPATCEIGEVIESGGKLKICSAANTWTTVGTQT